MLSPAPFIDDVRRILGDIRESKSMGILAMRPTLADVEQAALWASGDGDIRAKSGHPQTAVIAEIVDMMADEEEYERG